MGVAKGMRRHPCFADIRPFTGACEEARQCRVGQRLFPAAAIPADQKDERRGCIGRALTHDIGVQGVATQLQALIDGDRVEIRGFGSFSVRDYAPYTGRNPKTGAVATVGPKRLPVFKAGRRLKALLNE